MIEQTRMTFRSDLDVSLILVKSRAVFESDADRSKGVGRSSMLISSFGFSFSEPCPMLSRPAMSGIISQTNGLRLFPSQLFSLSLLIAPTVLLLPTQSDDTDPFTYSHHPATHSFIIFSALVFTHPFHVTSNKLSSLWSSSFPEPWQSESLKITASVFSSCFLPSHLYQLSFLYATGNPLAEFSAELKASVASGNLSSAVAAVGGALAALIAIFGTWFICHNRCRLARSCNGMIDEVEFRTERSDEEDLDDSYADEETVFDLPEGNGTTHDDLSLRDHWE
jgi:hypothetical protein